MTDGLRCALAVLAVAWIGPVPAEEASGIRTEDSLEASTALAGSSLTASERARSRSWGLTQAEWHRYRQLMQGIRASVSPATISPVEVLGIHARDAAERYLGEDKELGESAPAPSVASGEPGGPHPASTGS